MGVKRQIRIITEAIEILEQELSRLKKKADRRVIQQAIQALQDTITELNDTSISYRGSNTERLTPRGDFLFTGRTDTTKFSLSSAYAALSRPEKEYLEDVMAQKEYTHWWLDAIGAPNKFWPLKKAFDLRSGKGLERLKKALETLVSKGFHPILTAHYPDEVSVADTILVERWKNLFGEVGHLLSSVVFMLEHDEHYSINETNHRLGLLRSVLSPEIPIWVHMTQGKVFNFPDASGIAYQYRTGTSLVEASNELRKVISLIDTYPGSYRLWSCEYNQEFDYSGSGKTVFNSGVVRGTSLAEIQKELMGYYTYGCGGIDV